MLGVACHFFQCLGDLLARAFAVQRKAGQLLECQQRTADRLNQLAPVHLANQAQAVDDVADGEVGGDLRTLAVRNQCLTVGTMQVDPVGQQRCGIVRLLGYALPQLGKKAALQAPAAHDVKQPIQIIFRQRALGVPDGMGRFPASFTFSNMVCHPPQIFKQNNAQCGGQCPQLTQAELIDFLVGAQKSGE